MFDKLYELMRESVLTQAIIVIGLLVIVGVLLATSKAVPPELYQGLFLTLGFYFGGKAQMAVSQKKSSN